MSLVLDVASWALILAGGLACVTGALGMLRMPDFYTRIHAASVSDTVGAALVLAGLLLQAGPTLAAAKLAILLLLLFFTSPAAGHALARAAFARGLAPLLGGEEGPSKR